MLIQLQEKGTPYIFQLDQDSVENKNFATVTIMDEEDKEALQVQINIHELHGALTAFIEAQRTSV